MKLIANTGKYATLSSFLQLHSLPWAGAEPLVKTTYSTGLKDNPYLTEPEIFLIDINYVTAQEQEIHSDSSLAILIAIKLLKD